MPGMIFPTLQLLFNNGKSSCLKILTTSSTTATITTKTTTTTTTTTKPCRTLSLATDAAISTSSSSTPTATTTTTGRTNESMNRRMYYDQTTTPTPYSRPHAPLISSSIGSDVEMIAANHRIACGFANNNNNNEVLSLSKLSPTTTGTTLGNSKRTFTSGAMKDEYGQMDSSGETYTYPDGDYVLESGQILPITEIRYQTYGTLNSTRDNVLVVCHALTGNASLHSWWGDLLGPGKAFDTDKYYIVCCNVLGSCYGSTSAVSINPMTGRPYGIDFPDVSVKDTVRLQLLLLQHELQINSIQCVIGGSFGGMQALEYAIQGGGTYCSEFTDSQQQPYVKSCIPIACGSHHTAWQIGISEVQRQAIYKDPEWLKGNYFHATSGLEIARQLGMISYRTATGYDNKFGREKQMDDSPEYGALASWQVKKYLEYQGMKFLNRFDPITYVKLTEQMDSHNIIRGRSSSSSSSSTGTTITVEQLLQQIDIPTLVLGIDSDVLYPLYLQRHLADNIPYGTLQIIHSMDGHDGFLLEQDQVAKHMTNFLNTL